MNVNSDIYVDEDCCGNQVFLFIIIIIVSFIFYLLPYTTYFLLSFLILFIQTNDQASEQLNSMNAVQNKSNFI